MDQRCCEATIWSVETGIYWSIGHSQLSECRGVSHWSSSISHNRSWEIQQIVGTEHIAISVYSSALYWQFNFFWDRRYLFKADGLCLNKSGIELFSSNLYFFLCHSTVPSAKDKRLEESKQGEDITQHARNLVGEPPQSEESSDHGRHHSLEEESPSPSLIITFEDSPSPTCPPQLHLGHCYFQTPFLLPPPCWNSPTWSESWSVLGPNSPPPLSSPSSHFLSPKFHSASIFTQSEGPRPFPPSQWCQTHPLSPQPDISTARSDICVQNAASTNWYVLGPGYKANDTYDSSQDKPGPSVPVAFLIPVLIGNRKRIVNLPRNRMPSTNFANLASIPYQQWCRKMWKMMFLIH